MIQPVFNIFFYRSEKVIISLIFISVLLIIGLTIFLTIKEIGGKK